jgi:hypothetical protein
MWQSKHKVLDKRSDNMRISEIKHYVHLFDASKHNKQRLNLLNIMFHV